MTHGDRILLIGGSTGLGRACARLLCRAPHRRLVVAGRDVARTHAAIDRAGPAAVEVLPVELESREDVARFVREAVTRGPFDTVICNAGLQPLGPRGCTRDGVERTFAVNHLAHAAIVWGLAGALAPAARILWIGSGTIDPRDRGARRFGFRGALYSDARTLAEGHGDPSADDAQRALDRYATSKLCNVLMVRELARRVPASRLAAFALDPGLMPGTGLARDRGAFVRFAWHALMPLAVPLMPGASTPRRSAGALAWLATEPSLAGRTGLYYDFRRQEVAAWEGIDRADWAADLYDTSLAWCGFDRDPLLATA